VAERIPHHVEEFSRSPANADIFRFRRGDVELLQEEVRPRPMWKTAVFERLIEGRDGRIRTVAIRASEGNKITRPIQLVIPFEVDQGGEVVEECLSS
jgi:hypothetical protein